MWVIVVGFLFGFGGAFAYAKQAAAFAAEVRYPNERLLSASVADPAPCRMMAEALPWASQNRKLSHPPHQAALR